MLHAILLWIVVAAAVLGGVSAVLTVRTRRARRDVLVSAAGLLVLVMLAVTWRLLPRHSLQSYAVAVLQGVGILAWAGHVIVRLIPSALQESRSARQSRRK